MKEKGFIEKKFSARKFYLLYDQMIELLPLFTYLERLDAIKNSILTNKLANSQVEKKAEIDFVMESPNVQRESNEEEEKKSFYCNSSGRYGLRDEGMTPFPIDECCICLDKKSDVVIDCTHAFCSSCI
jgi:hypothetical protein